MNMLLNTHERGIIGELIAKLLLSVKLYKIIRSRFKTRFAEIDLIAVKGNYIIFIEVKYRKKIDINFYPIDPRQLSRIRKAAEFFISRHPKYSGLQPRFDYLEIALPKIRHLINAF